MKPKYHSGEEVIAGDKIEYFHEPGEIEFIADPEEPSEQTKWFVEEFGRGAMVKEPKFFGSVFITETEEDTKLVFLARRSAP